MKYFDAHTHVNFVAFEDDREAAIQRANDAGGSVNACMKIDKRVSFDTLFAWQK